MTLTVTEAKRLTGGLGSPSKMPGLSYGLPAAGAKWVPAVCKELGLPVPPQYGCPVGAKLAEIEGTTCFKCYADQRGMYKLANPMFAQVRRLCSLYTHLTCTTEKMGWCDGMAFLIGRAKEPYFRWHDSGDLLGGWHLDAIIRVCKMTPHIKHWLPTREAKLVSGYPSLTLPRNLTVRVSATKVDAPPPKSFRYTSTVDRYGEPVGHACPAPEQDGQCGPCRECWHKRKRNVSYHLH